MGTLTSSWSPGSLVSRRQLEQQLHLCPLPKFPAPEPAEPFPAPVPVRPLLTMTRVCNARETSSSPIYPKRQSLRRLWRVERWQMHPWRAQPQPCWPVCVCPSQLRSPLRSLATPAEGEVKNSEWGCIALWGPGVSQTAEDPLSHLPLRIN